MAFIKNGKIHYNKRELPYEIVLVLIILLETCFLSIPGVSTLLFKFNNYHDKRIILLLSVILLMLIIRLRQKRTRVDFLFFWFLLSWIFISIISSLTISSTWVVLDAYYFYGVVLLYIPATKLFDNFDSLYNKFLSTISIIGTIYAIYFIIAKYLYDYAGKIIINEHVQYFQVRNGLRLARPSDFWCFAFIATLCLLVKECKKKYFFRLAFIGTCIFWVGQTRIYEILVVFLVLIYLFLYTKISWKFLIFVTAVFAWQNIVTIYHGFIDSFFAKDTLSSTLARTQGYEIVSKKIFDHVLFGSGFDGNIQFSLGGWNYALSDLGALGFISVWGILGIIFIVLVLILMGRSLKQITVNKQKNKCPETIFLTVWFVFSCISVSFSDVQRIIYLPFMFLMLRQNLLYIEGRQ